MQYDWTGVRTRRIALVKIALYVLGAILAITMPVFIIPDADLSSVTKLVAADGVQDLH
ncbi:hypothetical protein [Rhizobium halophilum]|uniref:hypothetical protein n=1 Tax=Rhizobium halophilum TaxID=2846852 RepID=UPI001EFCBF9E|nr:hypothetical protein [Rhizobium halophilum]MCF6370870.1 hypothetical protein [Rhizobium halophilum]